ncbi:2-methylcitrate dehydratase PrpD [Chelatococcus asaccharovorans]|uniref:2-methylcitrate dehydratase PrpD n=1 Tax=Chelatococcus asaccharovorans TaxID=28210 RepID=A0A2V3U4Z6_9HYPH|nr:2-methylcitrate dehydratase PrpD [Chelatococcus asaccharovorans]
MSATSDFAGRLVAFDVAESDIGTLNTLLLDQLAVALFGSRQPVSQASEAATGVLSRGPAVVVGRNSRVGAEQAAFLNGVSGHSYELDDTHDGSLSHPGAAVIGTALAAAAETGATGRQLLGAIVAGYEAMGRIGVAADAPHAIARGLHPTSLFGVFGAATAALRLIRPEPQLLERAWGHSLSLASGSMQFSQEPDGAEVKRLHAGFAARNGVLAARLAVAGISAPLGSIEGRYGLFALVGGRSDARVLTDDRPTIISEISIKPYACNRLFHAAIDALGTLTGFAVDRALVRSLVIRGPRKLMDQHMVRRPASSMAAQYSLPFAIGAALTHGPHDLEAFTPTHLANAEILAWADMVQVEVDPGFEKAFPAHFGAEVEIVTRAGEVRSERVLDSLGTTARPMDGGAVRTKAAQLVAAALPGFQLGRLVEAIEQLWQAPDVSALQAALQH